MDEHNPTKLSNLGQIQLDHTYIAQMMSYHEENSKSSKRETSSKNGSIVDNADEFASSRASYASVDNDNLSDYKTIVKSPKVQAAWKEIQEKMIEFEKFNQQSRELLQSTENMSLAQQIPSPSSQLVKETPTFIEPMSTWTHGRIYSHEWIYELET